MRHSARDPATAGPARPLPALTLRSLSLPTLPGVIRSALGFGGSLTSARNVDLHTDLHGLRITGHGPFPYQVDGDYLGEASELIFRHEPAAIRLLVP